MQWLLRMTLPFAFLACAACGDPSTPGGDTSGEDTSGGGRPAAEAPAGSSAPAAPEEGDGTAQDDPTSWPAVDDDPSLDRPPGSGDWCGTGMRHGPFSAGWIGPDEDGVFRLVPPGGDVDRDRIRAAPEKRLAEIEARLEDEKDPEVRAKLETARKQLRALTAGGVWLQPAEGYGMNVGGVFHRSEPGESREDFMARMARRKAEEAPRAPAKPAPGPAGEGDR